MIKLIIIILSCSVIMGCANSSLYSQKEIPREIVMSDGMKICATDNNEHICVIAEGDTTRIISYDGEDLSINLIPRKRRWHGTLGLTAPKQPGNIWKTHQGLMRVLITEAQIHYNNAENALEGLSFYREDGINVAYNDSGLLVMWRKTAWPDENVLDLSIFQIIINGEKPKVLPGSQNNKINITNK